MLAGASVTYTIRLANTGNTKLRAVTIVVPMEVSYMPVMLTCAGSSGVVSGPMDIPAGEAVNCTMQFTMGQAAIELGSVGPFALVSSASLQQPLSQALQQLVVPSNPSVAAWIAENACTPPSSGGLQ